MPLGPFLPFRGLRSGTLRRRAGDFLWDRAPGLMEWRLRRRGIPRPVVAQPEILGDPLLLAAEAKRLEYRPLISVLVPVYNTAPRYLRLAADSVIAQAYPVWELVLCDDGSTRKETLDVLEGIASLDSRVRVHRLKTNSGIAKATNAALAQAHGDFVAMLDHDDELLPATLLEVVKALEADRTLDVVYTDQDYIDVDGSVAQTFYKPDWSLEMFRGVMYVGHLLVVRRSLADAVGGFDPAFDNVQDFEFMLRVAETTDRIAHIPRILYHWRKAPGSVAWDANEKRDIEPLQAAAVTAHLERCGVAAIALSNPRHTHRLLISPIPRSRYPLISVIVRASGAEAHLETACKRIVAAGGYPNREVIVAGGCLPDNLASRLGTMGIVLKGQSTSGDTAVLAALKGARGDLIVSLSGELEVQTSDWLEHLLFVCDLPGVACATPLVLSTNGKVASAGLIIGGTQAVFPAMRGWQPDVDGYAGSLSCVREVSAVSGECFAVTRRVLDDLGGLNPYFASDYFQGVDLSIRAHSRGLRNLCTPRVVVRHLGAISDSDHPDRLDQLLFSSAWGPLVDKGDPFHNRNFLPIAPGYQT